jgi:hypothetical protein
MMINFYLFMLKKLLAAALLTCASSSAELESIRIMTGNDQPLHGTLESVMDTSSNDFFGLTLTEGLTIKGSASFGSWNFNHTGELYTFLAYERNDDGSFVTTEDGSYIINRADDGDAYAHSIERFKTSLSIRGEGPVYPIIGLQHVMIPNSRFEGELAKTRSGWHGLVNAAHVRHKNTFFSDDQLLGVVGLGFKAGDTLKVGGEIAATLDHAPVNSVAVEGYLQEGVTPFSIRAFFQYEQFIGSQGILDELSDSDSDLYYGLTVKVPLSTNFDLVLGGRVAETRLNAGTGGMRSVEPIYDLGLEYHF